MRNGARRSVKRNYAIALVANSIQSAAKASNENDNRKAEKKLRQGVEKAKQICDNRDDKNLKRMIKISNEYRDKVSQSNKLARGRNSD